MSYKIRNWSTSNCGANPYLAVGDCTEVMVSITRSRYDAHGRKCSGSWRRRGHCWKRACNQVDREGRGEAGEGGNTLKQGGICDSFSSCKVTPITQPLSLFLVGSPLVSACFFALVNCWQLCLVTARKVMLLGQLYVSQGIELLRQWMNYIYI